MAKLTPEEKEELRKAKQKLKGVEASKDLTSYIKLQKESYKIAEQLRYQTNLHLKAKAKQIKIQKEIDKIGTATTKEEEEKLEILTGQLETQKKIQETTQKGILIAEREVELHNEQLEGASLRNASIRSFIGLLAKQLPYLYEQQKAVRNTELSMGILSDQANGFRQNIYKTSISTNQIGIDSKGLAEIQGKYSETLGSTVQLSQMQLEAVAALAAGTNLGAEGAGEFAANMENFGISAERSVELVEDMMNSAHSMGVNSAKVIESLGKNMKMAQKYTFKGGIKGLSEMAALTTKFKLEMGSVAGFADKLFTVEGAVEAAAKLQVLGGAWGKLGDPFELMFRARNDMKGLTQDIIEAANNTAVWNAEIGEFKIDPMELHRLREVANVTGMSAEELAEMAKQSAKLSKVKSLVGGAFTDEDKEYIANLSQFNTKSKKFEFSFLNEDGVTTTKNVEDMGQVSASFLQGIREQKESLADRAKQAQTLDESWDNLMNTLKSLLLPAFEVVSAQLQGMLQGFTKWANDTKAFETLAKFGETLGGAVVTVIKKMIEYPWLSLGVIIGGQMAQWYLRGKMLGVGFNSSASMSSMAGKGGGAFGGANMVKGAKGISGAAGNFKAAAGSGMAIGGGALAAGMSGWNEWSGNKEKGMGSGENAMRTGARASGAGLGAWGGAAAGAAIGSVVPVIGTAIGGIIGGILGGMSGDKLGDLLGDQMGNSKFDDFVSRPGSNPVSFSGKDTLIGAKPNGPIDKMLSGGQSSTSSTGRMQVEFNKPLTINGQLELMSDGKSAKIDLSDPILMRNLSRVIQEELSKAINGGKLASGKAIPT